MLDASYLGASLYPARSRFENTTPVVSMHDRGVMKCVPLKVDRKLYNATSFAKFNTDNFSVNLTFSVCRTLSSPMPRSRMLCGAMRGGLVSAFAVPAGGITSRVAP